MTITIHHIINLKSHLTDLSPRAKKKQWTKWSKAKYMPHRCVFSIFMLLHGFCRSGIPANIPAIMVRPYSQRVALKSRKLQLAMTANITKGLRKYYEPLDDVAKALVGQDSKLRLVPKLEETNKTDTFKL